MCCYAFINCPPTIHLPFPHSSLVDVRPEVYDALMNRRPVVALESTIITHGMPHPHNLDTAIEVENIVREQVIEFHSINTLLSRVMNHTRGTLNALLPTIGLLFKLTVPDTPIKCSF